MQIKVVNRELDPEMLQAQPDAAYLMSITEQELPTIAHTDQASLQEEAGQHLSNKTVRIGMCAVDVATARILLGQW